ncbi:MAG: Smr/MutS family protein [Putridiphycobacter sp.]|nr:Smr/MutS family protein [Putridiphycobacter sp.]
MFKIGDSVSVIHDVIKGTVKYVHGHKILLIDEDGFERTYKVHEIVKIESDNYVLHDHLVVESIETKDAVRKRVSTNKTTDTAEKEDSNPYEIDLHIEVLFPEAAHWSTADILQKQMISCRAFVEKAIANKSKHVVLIHGKGEGVLKSEIFRYLNRIQNHLHVGISYHDADFRTFGTGATQVNFIY